MFFIQKLINNNLFKIQEFIQKDFLKRMAYTALKQFEKRMFDSFVFLPLSTRAYFKGRAYIKIILKNHAGLFCG